MLNMFLIFAWQMPKNILGETVKVIAKQKKPVPPCERKYIDPNNEKFQK